MHPAHVPSANARYSRLKPIWLRKKPIQSRSTSSIDPEDTSTTNSSPKHTKKNGIYIRAFTFILLEAIFLIFAYYCLLHPILLQSHPDDALDILPSLKVTLTELKAGIAAASVAWHTLACLLIKDITAAVCSAEFMAQYQRLGSFNPRTSDRVSTLTSGFIDNIVHFVKGSSTGEFRLALVVMLILTVVGPLGSGTVTVGAITATTNEHIQVTNLASDVRNSALAEERISLIMRIEKEQNTTFKYDMNSSLSSDPVLIPWPTMDRRLPRQSTLIYQSDILHFRFHCGWVPSSSVTAGKFPTYPGILIDNGIYSLENAEAEFDDAAYGVRALFNTNIDDPLVNATILFFAQRAFNTSVELHWWKNMSLSMVPYTFPMIPDQNHTLLRTGAILRCYPGTLVAPAKVTLAGNSLTAERLPEDSALIGNIPPPEAAIMVRLLTSAMSTYKPSADQMFLKVRRNIPFSHDLVTVEWEPLSLDEIAANIESYMQSAGKAYLSGIIETHPNSLSSYLMALNQTAQIALPVAALVSSKPFLVVFTVVIGVIVLLLLTLFWTIRATELNLFNLVNLMEILGSKQ